MRKYIDKMNYADKIKIFLEIYKNIDKENFILDSEDMTFRTVNKHIVISNNLFGSKALIEKEYLLYLRYPVKKINLLSVVIEDYHTMDQTQFILIHGKEPFGDFSFFENIDKKDIEQQLSLYSQ